ncbi:hypothetical protein UlMin_036079 [Ulmus minor]
MLKQSPSRNQRSKEFKVKHALHICLLLAICIWLLYQLKHNHDKKKAYGDSSSKLSGKLQNGNEIIKLGRRDLQPRVKEASFEIKMPEGKEEVEESKLEEIDGDDGRGGGDDEIDGRDQERAEEEESEEVEDLIDDEDREREEETDELESEDKGVDFEDVNSLDQTQHEGKSNTQEAREVHYKDDDASNNMKTLSLNLRKVQEEEVEQENEKYGNQDSITGVKDSGSRVDDSLFAKSFPSEDAGEVKEKSNEFGSALSDT